MSEEPRLDEDMLRREADKSKGELEEELERIRKEILDTHAILDRVGSDSRKTKPATQEEAEHRLPARLNRYVSETQGAILKLLDHCGTGGPRG